MFGQEMRERVLELNASNERGIDVIRDKVKTFARMESKSLRLIILDEADSMTVDAQAALRRMMETNVANTRFIIICNYVNRIIDPLRSRCARFRFTKLNEDAITMKLQLIAKQESINLEMDVIKRLVSACDGDLRKCIMILQTTHRMTDHITIEKIDSVIGTVPHEITLFLLSQKDMKSMRHAVKQVIADGYDIRLLLVGIQQELLKRGCSKHTLLAMAKADYNLTQHANEYLQLMSVMTSVQ